ncbi:MAG: patatin-like phospholipase family protein [Hyphomicrobiaceae bacterium]|nr:patatin-like phospholipase family protein [Hyphomicrobiaceae bacterium]
MSGSEGGKGRKALPAHCAEVGLVLQGGGALGAYQAGVFQALAEHGYAPGWIAGVSIGAINGAIIAGNPPERRLERLIAFWELLTDGVPLAPPLEGDIARGLFNEWSAFASVAAGVAGFYRPRVPPAWLQPWGTPAALSAYDTAPLRETLLSLVDFDLLNHNGVRLSVGAANIRKGNSVYFDTTEREITVDHVMASAALPPGFPPVEINGEHYWDGGVVSNTPLQYVIDAERHTSMLVFQVDLFSAAGEMPRNLLDVYERHKDILYSSRTRLNTDVAKRERRLQKAVERLLDKVPGDLKSDPDVQVILANAHRMAPMSVVHLIYRQKNYETQTKDYEFSRVSMREHWQSGYKDTKRSLEHEREWLKPPEELVGIRTFDIIRDFD